MKFSLHSLDNKYLFPPSWELRIANLTSIDTKSSDTLAYARDHVLRRLIKFLEDAESAGRACSDMSYDISIRGSAFIDTISEKLQTSSNKDLSMWRYDNLFMC